MAGILDGFRAWLCSLVLCCPARSCNPCHGASSFERANVARQNGPVGVRCAPVWCTGCMCLPTAPGAISGRASGVRALQVSHPGSRYPGWCTVVQRCQEWLGKAGTSLARLETRTKESIGGRRQCCACSQSWYGATGGGARCAAALAGFGLRDPTQGVACSSGRSCQFSRTLPG